MKVDITKALNDYFKYDIMGIIGFKNDKEGVSGIVKNDTFFENNNNDFDFVATHEVEFNKKVLGKHPIFIGLVELFYLPVPSRVLCDGINPGAFIYPDFVFIVGPVKEV
ncbi:hypothetical protein KAR91_45945 [Candidatus Pacearchaeota archaeon]|nr:hypothetical protein [Candidatus Pacearchaeota archaeon]